MKSLRILQVSKRLAKPFKTQPSRSSSIPRAFSHSSYLPSANSNRPVRYGTARKPPTHLSELEHTTDQKDGNTQSPPPSSSSSSSSSSPPKSKDVNKKSSSESTTLTSVPEEPIALPPPSSPQPSTSNPTARVEDASKTAQSSMERVLDVNSPNMAEDDKPPHLQAPKYVHHFDSWSLVKDLQVNGAFTAEQSTTIMKAVRALLTDSMDLARKALVSKSNVENEVYLFRAACAELKTEIQNNRKAEADTWRSQRAQVQHEVDILNQKITQDVSHLKDELRGAFDDRKMNVKMDQKQMDGKIQELNYKITVALNSDARGSVEAMRWLLTRRAGTALAIATLMVLGTLNYSRYTTQSQDAERKRHAEALSAHDEVVDNVTRGGSKGLTEEVLLAPEGVTGG